jgi:hypothetical protein
MCQLPLVFLFCFYSLFLLTVVSLPVPLHFVQRSSGRPLAFFRAPLPPGVSFNSGHLLFGSVIPRVFAVSPKKGPPYPSKIKTQCVWVDGKQKEEWEQSSDHYRREIHDTMGPSSWVMGSSNVLPATRRSVARMGAERNPSTMFDHCCRDFWMSCSFAEMARMSW